MGDCGPMLSTRGPRLGRTSVFPNLRDASTNPLWHLRATSCALAVLGVQSGVGRCDLFRMEGSRIFCKVDSLSQKLDRHFLH